MADLRDKHETHIVQVDQEGVLVNLFTFYEAGQVVNSSNSQLVKYRGRTKVGGQGHKEDGRVVKGNQKERKHQ